MLHWSIVINKCRGKKQLWNLFNIVLYYGTCHISFQIKFKSSILNEIYLAKHDYMNSWIYTLINVLVIYISIKSSHVHMYFAQYKTMILGTTELDVRNMSADLCTRNILDQKLSIFQPKGKGLEHASNVKFARYWLISSLR